MMTFVVGDFPFTAACLDQQRLLKQIVEAMQILNTDETDSWRNHPAVHMWRGFEDGLRYYINCMIHEHVTVRGHTIKYDLFELVEPVTLPWWCTWDVLINSHRAMLLRKNPPHYHTKFTVPDEYMAHGYVWPSKVADPTAPLAELCAAIPPELVNARFCPAIIKSGSRKGHACGNLLHKSYDRYCGSHRRLEGPRLPRYCTAILRSGLRKGQPCNRRILDPNASGCGSHSR